MSKLADLMKDIKAKAAERKKHAKKLASGVKDIRMSHPTSGHKALIGKDVSKKGGYRITTFDDKGPVGHTEHDSLEDAADEALKRGFKP